MARASLDPARPPATDRGRRARLIEAARDGVAPTGAPQPSRREIELLQGPEGAAREAVLDARAAEWEFRSLGRKEREAMRGRMAGIDRKLANAIASLRQARDLDGVRAVLDAQAALRVAIAGKASALPSVAGDTGEGRGDGSSASGTPVRSGAKRSPRELLRLAILGGLLIATVQLALKSMPEDLPRLRQLPRPDAISKELKLRELHAVGELLFARVENWDALDRERRSAEAADACRRVRALGFAGLVLKDNERRTASTCTGADGGQGSEN